MLVNLSPRFKRTYQKLPGVIQEDFKNKIQTFIRDRRHPTLKTHKLKGKLQECFAFRLVKGYRVLFEFSTPDTVDLLGVGSHDILQKILISSGQKIVDYQMIKGLARRNRAFVYSEGHSILPNEAFFNAFTNYPRVPGDFKDMLYIIKVNADQEIISLV